VHTLKAIRVREYRVILCANIACTLLLPSWLLPTWIPVTTSRRWYITLLSLLRVDTGFLCATLESASVGGLADGLGV
jgi:hypothetical protein